MLAIQRRNIILSRLREKGSVSVKPLSEEFGVSEETIRRDLERLEQEGHATRKYGGAIYSGDEENEPPFSIRKMTNVEAKMEIAQKVAELISDGDFIMLDESSTATFVARAIKSKKNITILTNSVEILIELAEVEGWSIMSTGGELKKGALSLTGHHAKKRVRDYHVDKAIISCTGIDLDRGYTDAGEDVAQIKRAMMESASETILAVDSGKFDKNTFVSIGGIQDLAALVTDKEPDRRWKEKLKELDVELIY